MLQQFQAPIISKFKYYPLLASGIQSEWSSWSKFAHKLLTKFVKDVLQSCQICWHFPEYLWWKEASVNAVLRLKIVGAAFSEEGATRQ